MKILLPTNFDNLTFRKDGSVKLSFETPELTPEDLHFLLGQRNTAGWLLYSPNQVQPEDIPTEDSDIKQKTPSQRIRSVLFILYQQATEKGTFVGEFQGYYNENMERIIQQLKDKIQD